MAKAKATTDAASAPCPALARAPFGAVAGALLVLGLGAGCGSGETQAGAGGSSGPVTAAAADAAIDFGQVPEFTLITQDEEPLGRDDLLGRPWVLACIFTLCTGPCPSITKEVARLQRQLEDVDVRFISLSVDPRRDKPHMLRNYAEAYGADTTRWSFLTGEEDAVHRLVREGFKLPVDRLEEQDPETGYQLTHDQRLTVIDAEGRIRGWYDSQDPEQVELCAERLRFLAAEARAAE